MDRKKEWVIIISIIFTTVFLQILFLTPPELSDQLDYFFWADKFPNLSADPHHRTLRIGLLIPISFLIKFFNYSEIAYYLIPILSSVAFSIGIYKLSRLFFNRIVSLCSSILSISIPIFLRYAGQLLPDLPSIAMTIWSIFLLINSTKEVKGIYKNSKFHIFIGALLGWAYLVKEMVGLYFLIIALTFFLYKIPLKKIFYLVSGFLGILSLEFIFAYHTYQDAFIRFSFASPRGTEGSVTKSIPLVLTSFFRLLNNYSSDGYAFLLFLFLIGSTIFAIKKNNSFMFLNLWFLLSYFELTILGIFPIILRWEGFTILRLHIFRYWFFMIPPFIIGGTAILSKIIHLIVNNIGIRKNRLQMANGLILFTFTLSSIFIGVKSIWNLPDYIRTDGNHYQEFRKFLKNNGGEFEKIWLTFDDFRASERVIPIFTNSFFGTPIWEGDFERLNYDNELVELSDIGTGLVIVDNQFMNMFFKGEYLPSIKLPENWKVVFISTNKTLYAYRVL